jgi:FMN phosphatase YigB (HAD superfamily)
VAVPKKLSAVLIDIGGTLWSDGVRTAREHDIAERVRRLREAASGLELLDAQRAVDRLMALEHGTDAAIAECLQGLGMGLELASVRQAMCLSASGRVVLLPGATELLSAIRVLELRCIAVSNTMWYDGATYLAELAGFGLGQAFDGLVSSVDVGLKKPDRAMFDAAVALARCEPEACLMVGNSEAKDIVPARAMGMRTIRVAIEEPAPEHSEADAVATSLLDAASLVRSWTGHGASLPYPPG